MQQALLKVRPKQEAHGSEQPGLIRVCQWRIVKSVEGPVTVAFVIPFEQRAAAVWSEEELDAFVTFIAYHPTAGKVIPGSGGVRKARWGRSDSGKRGGVRVAYYYHDDSIPLFRLTVYAKNRRENLSPAELGAMRKLIQALKEEYGK